MTNVKSRTSITSQLLHLKSRSLLDRNNYDGKGMEITEPDKNAALICIMKTSLFCINNFDIL